MMKKQKQALKIKDKIMEYKGLIKLSLTDNKECTIVPESCYIIINRRVEKETHKEYAGERVFVRVDIMSAENDPIISYESQHAETLRKHVIDAMLSNVNKRGTFTHQHAAYVGYEIFRAFTDPKFIQD